MTSIRTLNRDSDPTVKEAVLRESFSLLQRALKELDQEEKDLKGSVETKALEEKQQENITARLLAIANLKAEEKKLYQALRCNNRDDLKAELELKLTPDVIEPIRKILYDFLLKKDQTDDELSSEELTENLIKIAKCWPISYDEAKQAYHCVLLSGSIDPGREVYAASGHCFDIDELARLLASNDDKNPCTRSKFTHRELLLFRRRGEELGVNNINIQPNPRIRSAEIADRNLAAMLPQFINPNGGGTIPLIRIIYEIISFAIIGSWFFLGFYLSVATTTLFLMLYGVAIISGFLHTIIKNDAQVDSFLYGAAYGLMGGAAWLATMFVCTSLLSIWYPSVTILWQAYQAYVPGLFLASVVLNKGVEEAGNSLYEPVILVGLAATAIIAGGIALIVREVVNFFKKLGNLFSCRTTSPSAEIEPRTRQQQSQTNISRSLASAPTTGSSHTPTLGNGSDPSRDNRSTLPSPSASLRGSPRLHTGSSIPSAAGGQPPPASPSLGLG